MLDDESFQTLLWIGYAVDFLEDGAIASNLGREAKIVALDLEGGETRPWARRNARCSSVAAEHEEEEEAQE